MSERSGLITMKGNPLTLTGTPLTVGDTVPDVTLLNTGLEPVRLSDYKDKVLILASVPSLDTSVCSEETKRFNAEAAQLSPEINVLTISMDLPFAQKRWVDTYLATNVTTLSDHKDATFGTSFGVLIKELRLLARAVFVVGKDGTLAYQQLVGEVTDPPDYDAALGAARQQVSA
ncbi:thiol peroxidase [Desulfohalobium retbaense]|uniref:Redoxin domain protein n=1 Tax=Desulfohalobium retbaense (strain ATCC 49708 / DSM 5692 / JCM 16813 / HR100) TaxID=485915 RepID=C8X1W3_DESRD|nr:thiol peroxidase [Desulfohalobium retbaense]ACV68535.1 Redoxin domain protein [Desulfohalobium retbaense DSM 5692]